MIQLAEKKFDWFLLLTTKYESLDSEILMSHLIVKDSNEAKRNGDNVIFDKWW